MALSALLRECSSEAMDALCETDGLSEAAAEEHINASLEGMVTLCEELGGQCHTVVTAVLAHLCISGLSPVAQIPER
jgi:hypothetical protein